MSNVNKVTLIGRLGQDPEVRYTNSGSAVANFSVATSESWKDKEGNKQERTEWHNIKMFGKVAEIAGQYLTKGQLVYLEGKLQTSKYTDRDGNERRSTEVVCRDMQMLGGKSERTNSSQDYHQPAVAEPQTEEAFNDDIPF